MAPTRRSTRAGKSTDQEAAKPPAASTPSTRATRARLATKTNSPVAKSKAKTTRKTASKTQAAPQAEEEEEEEEEEEKEEKPKPKAKGTRKAASKAQIVPEAEDQEVISPEEVESVVAAATRRSTRAASVASLQTPAKSKAARGRVTKKTTPAKRGRGAADIAEDGNEAVSDIDDDPIAPKKIAKKGRKLPVETISSSAPTAPAETVEEPTVVTQGRSRRGAVKKSKDPIEEPVVAESSVDVSATPFWAKRRGGRKPKVIEDAEIVDESVDQQAKAGKTETEAAEANLIEDIEVNAENTNIEAPEPEPVTTKGRGRRGKKIDAVADLPEVTVEIAEPESAAPRGRGGKRGKKVEIAVEVPEAAVRDTVVEAAEPEVVVTKGRGGRRGKKVEVVEEPEVPVEDTNVEVAEPEPVVAKGRGGRRGKKVEIAVEVPEVAAEDTSAEVAEPEPVARRGRGGRKSKVEVVVEVPEATVENTNAEAVEPEPIVAKGRGRKKGKKIVQDADIAESNQQNEGESAGIDAPVVEDNEAVIKEAETAEPEPVATRGRGRKRGREVDAVAKEPEPIVEDTNIEVAEPEPAAAKGRGRKKGKKVVQDAEVADSSVNQEAEADAETEVAEVGTVTEVVTEQLEVVVEDIEIEAAEPVAKGRGRKKTVKATPARKNTRKGRKAVAEAPEAEMSDTDAADTQQTEVDVDVEVGGVEFEAEPTAAIPTVKDSGVFLEDEPIVKEPIIEGPESLTEQSVAETSVEEPETIAQELSTIVDGEPAAAVQSDVIIEEVETEVVTKEFVASELESKAEQTETVAKETGVKVVESSKAAIKKSPRRVSKKSPKGKGKAKIDVSVGDVEAGETSIEGEKPGLNIELGSVGEELSADTEMLGPNVEVIETEPEHVARPVKPRKKARKSAMTLKKERRAKAAAKEGGSGLGSAPTSDAIVEDDMLPADVEENEVKQVEREGVIMEQKEVFEEAEDEGEPDLPLPFSSPAAKPTIILSPRRTTPDPDLDPIKTPVPSSPLTSRMSHPLNSSPLRQGNSDTLVLASPRQATTPSSSPSKRRSTPNTRTSISRLSESGTPFVRSLEDSRDAHASSMSTPARGQSTSVASSPIMMPPATPNVVAGDARSPIKQTPTKESEVVGDATLGEVGERSLLGSAVNINSSPVKNSSPIKAASEIGKSSPVGRLSFGGPDITQSSPLVGRLEINDPNLLLSSPLTMSSKSFSPTKAQQSSPTRSSPLKYSSMGSPHGFSGDETVGESSFMSFEKDYHRMNVPDDDVEGEEDLEHQEAFEYGEEVEEKGDGQLKTFSATKVGGSEVVEEITEDSVDFDATIDESRLFKLAEKAMLEGEAQVQQQEKEADDEEEVEDIVPQALQRNVLTSRVSDFEVSCLEQVHPELGQAETRIEGVQIVPKEREADIGEGEEHVQSGDVAEGDLTFSDCVGDGDSIPSSPVLDISSPIKFEYRPTNEIFPSRESEELEEEGQQSGPFSPIDMDFFGNRSFDTSAADWHDDEEEEEEEEEEEDGDGDGDGDGDEPDVNSPGGRLKHFRASSPPNIWPADEQREDESVGSESPASPKVTMPWDESDFDFSEEFIRPPSESPEPSGGRSFDFSKQLLPPSSPTSEKLAADSAEKAPLLAPEEQPSSPAAKDIPPITFEAGGEKARPIAKARKPKAKTDAWLGKKGLQPKEEKGKGLPMLEKSVDEEETIEMKGGKRLLATEGDGERAKRIRKDTEAAPELSQVPAFILPPKDIAEAKGGEKGRRQTFGGRPMAKATGPSKRRKSFPESPSVPDRQSYLYASDPERILRHWAQYEKDQAAPEPTVSNSPLSSVPADSATPSGDDSLQSPARPPFASSRPRRLRSVSSAGKSSPAASGLPSSPPSSGKGKRKADEPLDTGRVAKSSIPVSRRIARRPFNSKTQEEVDLVKKNTEHNALYSCTLDYEPIKMSGKRPPSLDHSDIQRLAAEARRKRWEAEELGLVLRPGEDEAFVPAEEQGEKRIRWDDQLEYGCGSDVSERPRARPEYLPNKGILSVKPPLNIHGNWIPTPGAPPLKIPQELVVVKKIVYKGEEEPAAKKGGKK